MRKSGPILIIDDDPEDQEALVEALQRVAASREIKVFDNGNDALTFLSEAKSAPFIIFCDLNMPVFDGLSIKKQIDSDPRLKKMAVPFIVMTTAGDNFSVNDAYASANLQGYFEKPGDHQQLLHVLKVILEYWQLSRHPGDRGHF
jgi:CheY-like chemotaxis protein